MVSGALPGADSSSAEGLILIVFVLTVSTTGLTLFALPNGILDVERFDPG